MEYIFILSRILFGGYFMWNGLKHLKHLGGTVGYASFKGVPYPKVAVIGTGIILLLGGFGILSGACVQSAVLLIVLFLVPVTFKMHAFWKETDPTQKMNERIHFEKNLALIGGALAYLFVSTPWMWSL